uniref:NADH-ubiquinone oxidoreductase chain 3 n=1 Tax=Hemiodoecus leai TaxID=1254501 RepID=A0A0U1XHR5_9HEMI|nr:NADH dehydrogenase subunit 3 [Hemiodoecus leai]AIS38309.1 NADH dehydrogenase subunit 3 [Hemiodoecus leai]
MMIWIIILTIAMIMAITLKKTYLQMEKNSPFECGYQPLVSARLPFSIHFFMIGIMFLILDIEIVLIMPFILIPTLIKIKSILVSSIMITGILLWGLIHEWNYQSLNWTE